MANKMLGVGRGQKRIVKLGTERFECWPLSWKQSTMPFGWSEFEPSPHAGIGSCTGVSAKSLLFSRNVRISFFVVGVSKWLFLQPEIC